MVQGLKKCGMQVVLLLPSRLEVGTPPPIAAGESGGALQLPQRVLAEPGRQTHSDAF